MNRRNFLLNTGLASLGAGLVLPSLASAATATASASAPESARRRVLRVAHLTDTHVLPNREGFHDSAAGLRTALRHAQGLPDRPDMIFFGGDLVMDSLKTPKEDVLKEWEVWTSVIGAELKLPAKYCIGNHDIWGWAMHDRPEIQADPDYGKGLVRRMLGIKDTYYSFDQAGWHFVVLDSMMIDHGSKHGYVARIDDAQYFWLEKDLAAVPATTPVCVLSHIPILSACVFFDDDLESTGSWVIPGAWSHIDVRRLKDLFHKHPNVKTCLSGHVHLVDDLHYLGVRYLCNGAVCGGWWKGPYQEFEAAYAIVDFFSDGSVENRLVDYTKA